MAVAAVSPAHQQVSQTIPPRVRTIPCGGRSRVTFQRRPLVMGILNVTPDSFSDGGIFLDPEAAIRHAEQMARDGADVIDVGGESTRPGAMPVSVEEELRRVLPVIRVLAKRLSVPLSIDTSKAEVARRAIDAGAALVNDVTALRGDPDMGAVIARARVPVILMHMRGNPRTMQQAPRYRDVVHDVKTFLSEAIRRAEVSGIQPDRILIDPGLGFGKTVTHNLLLLRHLDALIALGKPVVIGPSRKSFIGRVLVAPPARRDTSSPAWTVPARSDAIVAERLSGTLACVAYAMTHQVQMVRVHDVKPTVQLVTMWGAITDAPRRQRRSRRHGAPSAARRHP